MSLVTLSRKVREYFVEIGRRGGSSGRRELTPQQAKLMVAIREAKLTAKKEGKPPPKLTSAAPRNPAAGPLTPFAFSALPLQ
jgi:hypothetical protein